VFMPVLEDCKGEFMEFGLKILWGMQCGKLCNGLTDEFKFDLQGSNAHSLSSGLY
jgi:hypothetical protein